MEIHDVEEKKMQILKELAEATQKVGEARADFAEVKENEDNFYRFREQQALQRVANVLSESSEIITKIDENRDFITKITGMVFGLIDFLHDSYSEFESFVALFREHQKAWERHVEKVENTLADTKKGQDLLATKLKNKEKMLSDLSARLEQERKKNRDDRETLERSLKRLNEGKI